MIQSSSSRRGLSTARAALHVAWLLAAKPEGIRADEVADALGKSMSTAYNLLASLCEEGVAVHHPGGVYRLSPAFREVVRTGGLAHEPELHDLAGVVDDLLARTHKRSYVAVVRGGQLKVAVERGLQGMPKLPGFQPCIADNVHAVALGKVVLALARDDVVIRYARSTGLRRFTEHTITDHAALRAELDAVRARGYAVEREEFDRDFCCIAAPVRDLHGRFLAVIGISMSRRAFEEEHKTLARTVMAVARAAGRGAVGGAPLRAVEGRATGHFQASAETRHVLDRVPRRPLACVDGSTAP